MYGNLNRPMYAAPPPVFNNHEYLQGNFYNPPAVPQGTEWCEIMNTSPTYSAVWVWLDIETSGLNPLASDFGILEIAAVVTNSDLDTIDQFHVIVHQPESVIMNASKWCSEHFGSLLSGGNGLFDQCRSSAIDEKKAGLMLRDFIIKNSVQRKHMPRLDGDARRHLFRGAAFGNLESQCTNEITSDTILTPEELEQKIASRPQNKLLNEKKPLNPQNDLYRVMLAGCSCYFDRHVLLTRYPYLQHFICHKIIDATSLLEIARKFRPDLLPTLRPPTQTHRALTDVHESINILRWFHRTVLIQYC